MLSINNYNSMCDLSVIPADICKSRRLMDVKRGLGYLRTIDSLAHEQWTAHGKTPLIAASAPDLSLGPVKSTDINSTGQVRDKISKRNLSPCHKKSVSVLSSEFSAVSHKKGNGYSNLRKFTGLVNVNNQDGHANVSSGTGHAAVNKDGRTKCFNTWGSREWDQENKLVLEKQPRIIMPKQGIMMSRVAKDRANRRFRTNTDFRSRNGTIKIIQPPKPLPLIEQISSLSLVNSFDPDSLKREQTYMMLKRIDQLLHPSRVFKGDTTSSELEIRSDISSLTESMDVSNVFDGVNNRALYRKQLLEDELPKRSKTKAHSNSQMQQSFLFLHPTIIKKLEHSELDYYQKCLQWVDKYFAHSHDTKSVICNANCLGNLQ